MGDISDLYFQKILQNSHKIANFEFQKPKKDKGVYPVMLTEF